MSGNFNVEASVSNTVRVCAPALESHRRQNRQHYLTAKRGFDIVVALLALPFVMTVAAALILINPILNRGPLLYAQTRMGRRCKPFRPLKFRTMQVAAITRGPDDPLEIDRITPLGSFLRRTHIDEWPQFANVLLGQMSLIGPRPDYWGHAVHYRATVSGYRQRHALRPGITGLAQVDCGYAEGIAATAVKTRYDLRYLAEAGFRMDWYVLRRTIAVVLASCVAREIAQPKSERREARRPADEPSCRIPPSPRRVSEQSSERRW